MGRLTNNDGQVVIVDTLRRLFVLGVDLSVQQAQNAAGNTLSLVVDTVSGAGADDYVLYFENVGSYELNINSISAMATAATTLWIDHVSGTPVYVSATTTERTNRRLGDPTNPFIDSHYDTNITGLTQEGKLFFERLDTANKRYFLDTVSGISIPTGQALAIRSNNDLSDVTMNCSIGIVLL